MKNKFISDQFNAEENQFTDLFLPETSYQEQTTQKRSGKNAYIEQPGDQAEILVITSYPPRECGIAIYSRDLVKALINKFGNSFSIKVCALEEQSSIYNYPGEVKYVLDTTNSRAFSKLASYINQNNRIKIVLIQHEFSFFHAQEKAFILFVTEVTKPVSIVFHTVLPCPDKIFRAKVRILAMACETIIAMTHHSLDVLVNDYGIFPDKISVIAHDTHLVEHINKNFLKEKYNLPPINLSHLKKMTTDVGIIRFSKTNHPDLSSGYTLDDNACALIAMCMHFELTADNNDLPYIQTYLDFIQRCFVHSGYFENYIDANLQFTAQNREINLNDANGRAIWALGFLISKEPLFPANLIIQAIVIMEKAIPQLEEIHSTRAMAFIIKGLYCYQEIFGTNETKRIIETLSNRLVQMYKHESTEKWEWFESDITYANTILPEALLDAWLVAGKRTCKEVAVSSFRFLLSKIFNENSIEVISNRHWLQKGKELGHNSEQPFNVASTIMTLGKFYDVFHNEGYRLKMETVFNWFLGKNRLNPIIYNPCTGSCYDGLEEHNVNLNQGAESTVCYLLARLTIEKYRISEL
ncbi:MAG: hypothetical protein JW798_12120 [Prolixibacteraceae bacterium]|nr:hypothetical protein [Prolixibacteraceae bacterium]